MGKILVYRSRTARNPPDNSPKPSPKPNRFISLRFGLSGRCVTTRGRRSGWRPDRSYEQILRDLRRAERVRLKQARAQKRADRERTKKEREEQARKKAALKLTRQYLRELKRKRKERRRQLWRPLSQ